MASLVGILFVGYLGYRLFKFSYGVYIQQRAAEELVAILKAAGLEVSFICEVSYIWLASPIVVTHVGPRTTSYTINFRAKGSKAYWSTDNALLAILVLNGINEAYPSMQTIPQRCWHKHPTRKRKQSVHSANSRRTGAHQRAGTTRQVTMLGGFSVSRAN